MWKKRKKRRKKREKKAFLQATNEKNATQISPKEKFPGLSSTMVEVTMGRNYLNRAGDWITSLGSTNEMPRAEASSTEYEKVNKSKGLLPLNCFRLTALT